MMKRNEVEKFVANDKNPRYVYTKYNLAFVGDQVSFYRVIKETAKSYMAVRWDSDDAKRSENIDYRHYRNYLIPSDKRGYMGDNVKVYRLNKFEAIEFNGEPVVAIKDVAED